MKFLWIGLGGFAGAIARYVVGDWCVRRFGSRFPYGTFIINITGSLLIGFIVTYLDARSQLSAAWRYAIPVGFIGAYTTFSTFELETLRSIEAGWEAMAFLYALLSLTVGFAAVWAGAALARSLGPA